MTLLEFKHTLQSELNELYPKNEIDSFFKLAEEFNKNLETNNPIKAVVVPIEKYL